jgi:2,3-bisphosphoglycerate-independent phosphoglycerate mutase
MKFILIIGDDMADFPVTDLQGKTPLQVVNRARERTLQNLSHLQCIHLLKRKIVK